MSPVSTVGGIETDVNEFSYTVTKDSATRVYSTLVYVDILYQ